MRACNYRMVFGIWLLNYVRFVMSTCLHVSSNITVIMHTSDDLFVYTNVHEGKRKKSDSCSKERNNRTPSRDAKHTISAMSTSRIFGLLR